MKIIFSPENERISNIDKFEITRKLYHLGISHKILYGLISKIDLYGTRIDWI
ncbi:MAG: hypothetical protein IH840_12265 [Candidatus Heimdallarchaeota archaeon]|nr:hypothetical protein [Candidatus Heimdallarchaeota archaeon]